MKISKQRRKELRELYEKKLREEYYKNLNHEPVCSAFEWVEYMIEYREKGK